MKNQKTGNKGQSAMEYLMTYGWAILIITTAAVVIWQLGIFNLGSTAGSGYSGFGEVELAGFSYKTGGNFECILTNNAGGAININEIKVKIYSDECINTDSEDLTSGESETFTVENCPEGSRGDAYNLVLVISFTDNETSIAHTSAGNVWGAYE